MENVNLRQVDLKFHRELKKLSTDEEKWGRFEDYFNWLKEQVEGNVKNSQYFYWIHLSNACKFLTNSTLRAKEISKKWNGGLVASTYELSKWSKENRVSKPEEFDLKFGALAKKILYESDFATMVYCLSVLERDKVMVSLASIASSSIEDEAANEATADFKSDMHDKFKQVQFRYTYDVSDLTKIKLLTIDEARLNGVPYWLLIWPEGFEKQGLFVNKHDMEKMGFEPYEVKDWKKDVDESVDKMLEDLGLFQVEDGTKILNEPEVTLASTTVVD